MIHYNNKLWLRIITSLRKTDTLRILFPEILLVAAYTAGLGYLELTQIDNIENLKSVVTLHSLMGFVLGLLLVFRTNSAYDRWWEGRKHWGALVNNSRNLAIKIAALSQDSALRAFFATQISNYAKALKEHLRDNRNLHELSLSQTELEMLEKKQHIPNAIAQNIMQKLVEMNQNKIISNDDLIRLDKEAQALTDITGACERIKNTPIPYSYSTFLKKFIFLYIATLPIGLVPTFGYWSVLMVSLIFYVLVSLEVLAEEIEEPFGKDENDLPTQELSDKIGANVQEILLS